MENKSVIWQGVIAEGFINSNISKYFEVNDITLSLAVVMGNKPINNGFIYGSLQCSPCPSRLLRQNIATSRKILSTRIEHLK